MPVDHGIDYAILYFNQVTKTPEPGFQSEITYLSAIISVMKATWMLRAARSGNDYQTITQHHLPNSLEKELDLWGMSLERFFDKVEEVRMQYPRQDEDYNSC
jgi:hypothetical protein